MSTIMRQLGTLVTFSLLLAGFSGCQCCRWTERYMDGVDRVTEHEGGLEWMYCPALDLTRIGRRDWCAYRFNNRLCPCRCNQAPPAACPTYVHLGFGWENRAMKKEMPPKVMPDDAGVPDGNMLPEPTIPTPGTEQPLSPPVIAPQPEPVMSGSGYSPPSRLTNSPGLQPTLQGTVPVMAAESSPGELEFPKGISNSLKSTRTPGYVTPISGTHETR